MRQQGLYAHWNSVGNIDVLNDVTRYAGIVTHPVGDF